MSTDTLDDPLLPSSQQRTQRRAKAVGLAALCVTEIVSWGVLYYAFPVALSAITADTGWSAAGASAAFSAGLVVSAVVGISAGRLLDARGPRLVMTVGSVLAVPAVLGVAFAPTLAWFTVAWAVAGAAMAGCCTRRRSPRSPAGTATSGCRHCSSSRSWRGCRAQSSHP